MMNDLYLAHHGIKGMRWGVRRFQNPDGSLTDAGRRRQSILEAKYNAKKEKIGTRYDYEVKRAQEYYAPRIAKAAAKNEESNERLRSEWDRVKREGKVTTTKVRNKTFEGTDDKKYHKAKARALKAGERLEILKYNQKKDVALIKRLKRYEMEQFSKMTPDEYTKKANRRFLGTVALAMISPVAGTNVAANVGLLDRPTEMPKQQRVALERENDADKRKYRRNLTGSYW